MLHQGTRWVMRVSRLRACLSDRGQDAFTAAFERRQLTSSPSRLSRWEYGRTGASHRLLRAYEEGAGLPAYVLFALNDRQRRAAEDTFAAEPTFGVTDEVTPEEVYPILDRVVLGHPVTGSEWYLLAAFAAERDYFYLSPANTRLIARRLLEELARAAGDGYLLRFEALHLFASVARVDQALVEELDALIADDRTGIIGDAISLVLRTRPDRSRALVRRLTAGSGAAIQHSQDWIGEILRDRMPGRDAVFSREAVTARREKLCADLPDWATAKIEDDLIHPLVETALAGRSRLARHEAALLLMTARMNEVLDAPILDAFESEVDPLWRIRLAQVHQYLVPPSDPERLEDLALAETDPDVRHALWNSRAHARLPIEPTPAVLDGLRDPGTRGPLTMALGLTGSVDSDLLATVGTTGGHDVLSWWHERGPGLHD